MCGFAVNAPQYAPQQLDADENLEKIGIAGVGNRPLIRVGTISARPPGLQIPGGLLVGWVFPATPPRNFSLQHYGRQMFERVRQRQLISADALERISSRNDCAVVGLGVRPYAAALRKRCERFPNCYDDCIAAVPPREGKDVIAMWPDDFQRLIIAIGKNVGKLRTPL